MVVVICFPYYPTSTSRFEAATDDIAVIAADGTYLSKRIEPPFAFRRTPALSTAAPPDILRYIVLVLSLMRSKNFAVAPGVTTDVLVTPTLIDEGVGVPTLTGSSWLLASATDNDALFVVCPSVSTVSPAALVLT